MSEQIQAEIRDLVAEIIEVDIEDIQPGVHFVQDLGADSMSALEMMAALEKKYDIIIEPERLPQMLSLEQMTQLVLELLPQTSNPTQSPPM